MTKLILALAVIGLTGCASIQSKWAKVQVGQTKDQVVDIMGQPDQVRVTQDNKYAYGWNFTPYSGCGVILDDNEKVARKACAEDPVAKARYQQMGLMMLQSQMMRQPAASGYTPMPIYSAPRPMQTNCTTNFMGGTAYSNCSSQQTGLDTSIYNNIGR